MMQLRTLTFFVLGAFHFVSFSSAFSLPTTKSRNQSIVLNSASINDKDQSPRWIDRPRERVDNEEYSKVEIGIGRIAMVGFVGLLAGEVVSGESFGQQILDALLVASRHHG